MKLLMIYADRFAWRTAEKGLETAEEVSEERRLEGVLVGLVHAEAPDEADGVRPPQSTHHRSALWHWMQSARSFAATRNIGCAVPCGS